MDNGEATDLMEKSMREIKDPVKRPAKFACLKNQEVWETNPSIGDRPVYKIGLCIRHNECKKYGKAHVWSLDSPQMTLAYMKYHLRWSAKHTSINSEDEAQHVIDCAMAETEGKGIDWQCYVEPLEAFNEYKEQCDKAKEQNRKNKEHASSRDQEEWDASGTPPPVAKRGRHHDESNDGVWAESNDVQTMVDTAVSSAVAIAVRNAQGLMSSGSNAANENNGCVVELLGSARDTHGAAALALQEHTYAIPTSAVKTMITILKDQEEKLIGNVALFTKMANAEVAEKHKVTSMRVHLELIESQGKANKGKGKHKDEGKGKHKDGGKGKTKQKAW